MKTPRRFVSILFRLGLLLPALSLFPALTSAQISAVGTIEGRVFNPGTGEYLEFVRLTVNLSNIGDAPIDIEIAGPSTPAHAQFRTRTQYGSQWTFGLRGTF